MYLALLLLHLVSPVDASDDRGMSVVVRDPSGEVINVTALDVKILDVDYGHVVLDTIASRGSVNAVFTVYAYNKTLNATISIHMCNYTAQACICENTPTTQWGIVPANSSRQFTFNVSPAVNAIMYRVNLTDTASGGSLVFTSVVRLPYVDIASGFQEALAKVKESAPRYIYEAASAIFALSIAAPILGLVLTNRVKLASYLLFALLPFIHIFYSSLSPRPELATLITAVAFFAAVFLFLIGREVE